MSGSSLNAELSGVSNPVNPSTPETSTLIQLRGNDRKGVIAMAVAGITSCTLVSLLLLYIVISTLLLRNRKQQHDAGMPFIKRQVAIFVICLLVADLIQSISGVLQVKWAVESKLYQGRACIAQGAFLTLGDLGSTVWSFVIAVHTFSNIALGKKWSRFKAYSTVVVGWLLVGFLSFIGPVAFQTPEKGPFYGIAGDWCFITSNYEIHRLVIHYVPIFIAAVSIPVLYGLVFIFLRRRINFLSRNFQCTPSDYILRDKIAVAKRVLLYPVAYLTCVFPISIIRLVGLRKKDIPYSVWTFGIVVLFMVGTVDSIIYATTRNVVGPVLIRRSPSTRLGNASSSGSGDFGYGDGRKLPLTQVTTLPELGEGDASPSSPSSVTSWERKDIKDFSLGPPPRGPAVHVSFERIEEFR